MDLDKAEIPSMTFASKSPRATLTSQGPEPQHDCGPSTSLTKCRPMSVAMLSETRLAAEGLYRPADAMGSATRCDEVWQKVRSGSCRWLILPPGFRHLIPHCLRFRRPRGCAFGPAIPRGLGRALPRGTAGTAAEEAATLNSGRAVPPSCRPASSLQASCTAPLQSLPQVTSHNPKVLQRHACLWTAFSFLLQHVVA